MLGISYGELFLIIGATAALIGPKDLPRIARTAGRLAGRAIGYVQVARGQFETVMQQSQARQVHKDLQDTIAQLEAIRHEIRTISFMNPGPMTRKYLDNIDQTSPTNAETEAQTAGIKSALTNSNTKVENIVSHLPGSKDDNIRGHLSGAKEYRLPTSAPVDVHSQATAYSKLAESTALNSGSVNNEVLTELTDESGLTVLPVSAESAGLLPNQKDDIKGSDIVLAAVLEAEVAHNAKDFFAQPQNHLKCE
ncbi:hypothetical protein M9H77_01389 [Catharanthus roseus]|uniref:Uncharacterized protein n=1 Tax=Catharanthus roseus TaxID=4058 RepID=A0ACC0C5M7_CATRO|nr:hypothetical protein M9H77_01389 [Catharanthus roseus]